MINSPLELLDQPVAEGNFCLCYRHPKNQAILIKIAREFSQARKRMNIDLKYYRHLIKQGKSFHHVPRYLGPVETSIGTGHQFEFIKEGEYKAARTLREHLAEGTFSKVDIERCLQKLFEWIWNEEILVTDLRRANILLENNEGELKAWLVDGIGDHLVINFNFFRRERRNKIRRRSCRFLRKLLRENKLEIPTTFLSKEELTNSCNKS